MPVQVLDRTVTDNEIAVIGHAVVDPIAWVIHAGATVGVSAIDEKINSWRPEFESEKVRLGIAYKDRATRVTDQEAAQTIRDAKSVTDRAAQKVQDETDTRAFIDTRLRELNLI